MLDTVEVIDKKWNRGKIIIFCTTERNEMDKKMKNEEMKIEMKQKNNSACSFKKSSHLQVVTN